MSDLSSRFAGRRPTPDDATGVFEVVAARDTADIGYPDYSVEDAREELAEPGVDLERDAWVATDADGRVLAFALLTPSAFARVFVHPEACGAGIGTWLRERLEERARERGERVVRQAVDGANDDARRLL